MKAVCVFFLFVCFLLIQGHTPAYAKYNDSCSAGAVVAPAPTIKFWHNHPDIPLVKYNSLTEKKEDFLRLENEDEDEDSVFARKYVVLLSFFTTLVSASALDCFYSFLKNRLPFCSHLSYTSSYKYILQRVLRI